MLILVNRYILVKFVKIFRGMFFLNWLVAVLIFFVGAAVLGEGQYVSLPAFLSFGSLVYGYVRALRKGFDN